MSGTDAVRYELRGSIALIVMDDGKANALSHPMIEALERALDRAEQDAAAVLISGRPGRLSAGFDLATMTSGPEHVQRLVLAGAQLLLRMFTLPRPVIVACTGHALAAGAILLLASDLRLGAAGDFKIGLNEVSIQLTLPIFAMEMARARLSPRFLSAATTQARIFDPASAVHAGYLDDTVDPAQLVDVAYQWASRLAALPQPAFSHTKLRERGDTVARIRATLEADIAGLTQPVVGA